MDAVLNHVRGQFFAEHVCFSSITFWFWSKRLHRARTLFFSGSLSAPYPDKSAALTLDDLGTPLVPLVLFAILSSCMFPPHAPLFSDFFPHPCSLPLWSPAVKEIQNAFRARAHRSQDVTCRICFCPEDGQCSNHQEGLVCLLSTQSTQDEPCRTLEWLGVIFHLFFFSLSFLIIFLFSFYLLFH